MLIIQDILDHQFKDLTQEEVGKVIGIIHTHLSLSNYWVVDNLLRDLSPQASPMVIVTVLRSSYKFRDLLPNWGIYLNRTTKSLSSRGEDVNDILQGLLPQEVK